MKPGVKITIFILVLVTIGLGVYDVFAVWMFGPDATISTVVTLWSGKFPIIPFSLGFLMGHLFAQWSGND